MTRGMIYKLIFILLLIALSIALISPTVGEKKMKIVLKPDITQEQKDNIKKRYAEEGFVIEEDKDAIYLIGRNINAAVMNDFLKVDGVKKATIFKHWAEDTFMAKKINLGLDLQGGMHLVLRANFEKLAKKMDKVLTDKDKNDITQQALELIRNRIDKFGVAEPSIRPRGNEAIEVQLPGVKDPAAVKKALGDTGRVEYRLVDKEYTEKAALWMKENYKEEVLPEDPAKLEEILGKITRDIKLPKDLEVLYNYDRKKDEKRIRAMYPMVLKKKVSLAGSDISKAWEGQDEYGGRAVHFTTTAEGASKFAKVTAKQNHGKRLAVVIDDKIRSAPSLNVQITSGKALIQGRFSTEEVKSLALIIKEGALPVDLKIIEERTVGPSLGKDAIDSGVKAILIGLAGVMLFMLIYYKFSGIIANIGLVFNMILMLALLSLLGFTLTLPGIAGFILTVGMAVDANVIIFERIKEEIRNGKSVRMSIVYGYEKAFWTIFDANLTTLIAAFILSQFGTGPIKGFAVVLFIGVLSSMFVALYVTRFFYEIISLNKKIKKLSI